MKRKIISMRSEQQRSNAPGPDEAASPGAASSFVEVARRNSAANTILALLAAAAALHYAKLVFIVICVSMLFAFALEPLVAILERRRIPRAIAALLVLLLLAAALYGIGYVSYNRAVQFAQQLPHYATELRNYVGRYAQKVENVTGPARNTVQPQPSPVMQRPGLLNEMLAGLGTATEVALALSFIPFLVYFMLTWRDHAHRSTVLLFPPETRERAHITLAEIGGMIRSFLIGNLLIGLFIGLVSTIVFGILGIPYFYFIGLISGFLSLVPYLGVPLAALPPVLAGAGELHSGGILVIILTVLGLHLFSLNVLYPKFLGRHLQLNPLAVTVSLLVWGWIWGAVGLILAIPVTAAMKIIFDHIESTVGFGAWLGE
ncbi:MAG TPA: AI-2E family transporter [Candidatus Sulfotelmatobacter sp.]|nr:AI-2E family transporter [Candidatus Sulfotelmatobacter sp.]